MDQEDAFAMIVREAVAAERQRCAKKAELKSAKLAHQNDFDRGYACGREGAAADIRKTL